MGTVLVPLKVQTEILPVVWPLYKAKALCQTVSIDPKHMRAGGYCHYLIMIASRYFSRKKHTNMMPGGSVLVICHCRRVLLDAVQQADSLLGLGSLLRLPCSFVC